MVSEFKESISNDINMAILWTHRGTRWSCSLIFNMLTVLFNNKGNMSKSESFINLVEDICLWCPVVHNTVNPCNVKYQTMLDFLDANSTVGLIMHCPKAFCMSLSGSAWHCLVPFAFWLPEMGPHMQCKRRGSEGRAVQPPYSLSHLFPLLYNRSKQSCCDSDSEIWLKCRVVTGNCTC